MNVALHTLPPFREESQRRNEFLPVTERLSATGMNLPTFTELTEQQIERIAGIIRQFAK